MVLADLGRRIRNAIGKLGQATVINEEELNAMLKVKFLHLVKIARRSLAWVGVLCRAGQIRYVFCPSKYFCVLFCFEFYPTHVFVRHLMKITRNSEGGGSVVDLVLNEGGSGPFGPNSLKFKVFILKGGMLSSD